MQKQKGIPILCDSGRHAPDAHLYSFHHITFEAMVHGLIGALWEATTMRQLYGAAAATTTYTAYILFSYRGDQRSALAFASAQAETKKPMILARPSINEWMEREDKRIADGHVVTQGPCTAAIPK